MAIGNKGGRPPKPDNVHQLHGTRSRVTKAPGHESPDPEPVTEVPPPPHTLTTDRVQRKWKDTAAALLRMKVLTATDIDALESYCVSYDMMCDAVEEIRIEGLTIFGASGVKIKNPACNVLKDAQTELRQMGTLLGLNPSARTRINVSDKEKEKPQGLGSLQKPRRS